MLNHKINTQLYIQTIGRLNFTLAKFRQLTALTIFFCFTPAILTTKIIIKETLDACYWRLFFIHVAKNMGSKFGCGIGASVFTISIHATNIERFDHVVSSFIYTLG